MTKYQCGEDVTLLGLLVVIAMLAALYGVLYALAGAVDRIGKWRRRRKWEKGLLE